MASKIDQDIRDISPTLLCFYHSNLSKTVKRIHQEPKIKAKPKVLIIPKHPSHPLSLTYPYNLNPSIFSYKSTYLFQNFSLSHLFSNKTPDEKELAISSNHNQENTNMQTPIRQSTHESYWNGLKMADSHLNFTAESVKNQKSYLAQQKKSRPKQKGLRMLSKRAYQIVLKMRSVSYQDVAIKLIEQLKQDLDQEVKHSIKQGRDEQNIKRRVYDALNVLIALGVLRKQGRKIVANIEKESNFQGNKADPISQQIKNKKRQIMVKKQQLKNLQDKIKIYKKLAQNNPIVHQQIPIIQFPFLAILNDNHTKITSPEQSTGEYSSLQVEWLKSTKDVSSFDIDLLVSYQQKLQQRQER